MNLEDKIARGMASYIGSIEHNRAERRLIIKFLKGPEENRVDRILTFFAIEEFSVEEFEDEDIEAGVNVTDLLIGLDEYPEIGGVRYVVHTDLREMTFRTKKKPTIEDV